MPLDALAIGNDAIAKVLDEIGDLIELKGENVFRAVTYRAAARAIRDLREPLSKLVEEKRLKEIPKVGPSVAEAIEQLVTTGRSKRHEELQAAVPPGLLTLLRVPGVGPATGAERISIAGSLRRYRETIGDVDVVVASESAAPIMEAFVRGPTVERILAQGETKSSVVVSRGLQIDLRVVPPASYGAALLYFTGSKEHNVRLRGLALRRKLLLNEYGLYRVGAEARGQEIAAETEEDVYGALGLDWIPPELREDRGEIDAAAAHALPKLVGVEQVRGDLHTHTSWTDGRDPLADMARRAKAKGYAYLAVTDHSPGLGMTYGLSPERIQARLAEAAKLNAELAPFRIIVGTEVDIRANGKLDYPDEILARFDVVSASVHSSFAQSREQMTARITGAMRHPFVTALSHPTGRLLEKREPYAVDLDAVIAAAIETGTWIEVNGGPERLDLPDTWIRKAVDRGATVVVDSDAHAMEELEWMELGIATARRGWATAASVANTRPLDAMLASSKRRP